MTVMKISSAGELSGVPMTKLSSFHWEPSPPYRPETLFSLAYLPGEGFYCVLKCYEENPRAVFTENDDPVYRDSCLEFFFQPLCDREEYINAECNSRGVCLCEFGAGRASRRLVFDLAGARPTVTPFSGSDETGAYWGVTVFVSETLISKLYGVPENALSFSKVRANFYKCGNDTAVPHFLAFSPVTSLSLGFHNPACFAELTII